MTTSSNPTSKPIQIHIPPTLTHLAKPLTAFMHAHSDYDAFAVSAFIFTPPTTTITSTRKLLLIRRAPTERAFPHKWEIPGGGIEYSDPTILHSVAREVFEETGLRLTRFVREVGEGMEFLSGKERWLKLCFEIEVAEMVEGEMERVQVRLDPEEHDEFMWVDEGDISAGKYDIMTEELRELILEAFQLGKEKEAEVVTRGKMG